MESRQQSGTDTQAARTRVIVVGAGLAGLGAAWRLFRGGCDVSVLEGRTYVGGRIAGKVEDGFSLDPSLQVLSGQAGPFLSFINELGLSDRLLPLRPVRMGQVHSGQSRAVDARSLTGIARIGGVHWRDAPKLLRFERLLRRYRPYLDSAFPEHAADLDFRSVADFSRLYFGQSLFDQWIAPVSSAAMLDDAAELSRVAFLLAWIAGEGAAPGIARRGLHEVAKHAAEQLAVRTNVEVTQITPGPDAGFSVHCRSGAGEGSLEADAVILATGAAEAARLAEPFAVLAERDFFSQVRYGPSISISIALDRPLTGVPLRVQVPRSENSAIEVHLVEPGCAEGRSPTGCGLVTALATGAFSAANLTVSDEVVEKTLGADLMRWYPRLSEVARFARVGRWDDVVPRFRVGAYRALADFQRVQLDRRENGRRLYFAGDYLAGPSPESTYGSGVRVAEALARDFA